MNECASELHLFLLLYFTSAYSTSLLPPGPPPASWTQVLVHSTQLKGDSSDLAFTSIVKEAGESPFSCHLKHRESPGLPGSSEGVRQEMSVQTKNSSEVIHYLLFSFLNKLKTTRRHLIQAKMSMI